MTRLILDRRDISLEYATDCLIVRAPESPPRTLPLNRLSQIICLHSVALSTQLLGQLYQRGIDFVVVNQRYERHSFGLFANQQKQVERRCRQYLWQREEGHRLPMALSLCRHKFHVLERRLAEEPGTSACREQIHKALQQLEKQTSEASLRGLEGTIQRMAFGYWRTRLPARLGFYRRLRRPPPDPVNAALSLGYTLVHQEAVRQAHRHALDSQLGFYHRTAFGRHSLACDLMEPVRPQVEAWVISCFGNQTLDARHFSTSRSGCLLGKQGRQRFYAAYETPSRQWQRQLAAGARWVAHCLDRADQSAVAGGLP